jgi:hypothetical protein
MKHSKLNNAKGGVLLQIADAKSRGRRLIPHFAVAILLIFSLPIVSLAADWTYFLWLNTGGPPFTPQPGFNCSGNGYDDLVKPAFNGTHVVSPGTGLSITWEFEAQHSDQRPYFSSYFYTITNGNVPPPPPGNNWQQGIFFIGGSGCGDRIQWRTDNIGTVQNLITQSGILGPPYVLWLGGWGDGAPAGNPSTWNNPSTSNSPPNPISIPLTFSNVNPPSISFLPASGGTYSVLAPPTIQISATDNMPMSVSYIWSYSGANSGCNPNNSAGPFQGATLSIQTAVPTACGPGA